MLAALLSVHKMEVLEVPSINELLEGKARPYPYAKTFEEAKHEPLLVLHTSGTTGLPKPLVWTHDWVAAYYIMTQLEPPPGYESQARLYQNKRVFFMFPPFHVSNAVHLVYLSGLTACN